MKTYPELDVLSRIAADVVAFHINRAVLDVESALPYKAQYVLERTIEILQSRV